MEQKILPGAVNWMTAGKGISHSERFETLRAHGGRMHGLQAWVALPDADEEMDPAFVHHRADTLPSFTDTGVKARLIAGTAFGKAAPVQVRSPLFYLHLELAAGATAEAPGGYAERALYVVSGAVEADGKRINAAEMAVFGPRADAHFKALETSVVAVLGGEPVGARHVWWNFVSSRKERIEAAKADWREGRFKLPPADDGAFIPLPEGS